MNIPSKSLSCEVCNKFLFICLVVPVILPIVQCDQERIDSTLACNVEIKWSLISHQRTVIACDYCRDMVQVKKVHSSSSNQCE